MIQINQLTFVPELAYGDYAWKELQLSAKQIRAVERASDGIWVVSDDQPLVVAGVIKQSLLGTPRLWFLLCQHFIDSRVNFHLKALRMTVDLLAMRYPRMETYVEKDWRTGERFAKFCGFRNTERLTKVYDRDFYVWER